MEVLCFSHLRWNFVLQRPQHLLMRCARTYPVLYFEEPIRDGNETWLEKSEGAPGVTVLTPHIPSSVAEDEISQHLEKLIQIHLQSEEITDYIAWYYTPHAFQFTQLLQPLATVYDCMDELSLFAGADPRLKHWEDRLLGKADVVFTGGHSLFEAKKSKHKNIHPFPSSIDFSHFSRARELQPEPEDQKSIPHPRIGFFGVVDERFDVNLLSQIAEARPDWQFCIIGPTVKISMDILPRNSNIHYLGSKKYEDLPQYLASWDVAMLPFAKNDSTRFISPTKTPEYLAGGKPVVSTSITDVVNPYGVSGLVQIADTADEFVAAIERALLQTSDKQWKNKVDSYLSTISWDKTWGEMRELIEKELN